MKEKDTYQRVAIPMTDEQAHEVFACETCKGFSDSLQVLKEFIDIRATVGMEAPEFHKHLDLVASPDCDGQCVTGETMSIQCPCCKDRVHLNYSCYLPTEFQCPYCSADLTGGDHEVSGATIEQVTIRKIIKNHNEMKADLEPPVSDEERHEKWTAQPSAVGYGVPFIQQVNPIDPSVDVVGLFNPAND